MAGFNINVERLVNGLNTVDNRFQTAVLMFAETEAIKLESDMKTNRPWTDRTSAAKQRLKANAYRLNKSVRIELSHGVDYGIWLELANEKRFAIIEPTIRLAGPYVMRDFEGLLNRLKG